MTIKPDLPATASATAVRLGIRCASMSPVGDAEWADLRVLTGDCERPVMPDESAFAQPRRASVREQ